MIHFYGTKDHQPMLWDVRDLREGLEEGEPSRFCVLESYTDGKSWGINCDVPSLQAGWDFVSAWFASFYEDSPTNSLHTKRG